MDPDGWAGADDITEQVGLGKDPIDRWVGSRSLPAREV